jgi:hypothetical protein
MEEFCELQHFVYFLVVIEIVDFLALKSYKIK